MTDDNVFDIESLFQGLPPDQAKEIAGAMVDAARQRLEALKNPPKPDPYADEEAQELAELKGRVRGVQYTEGKRHIQQKYARMRAEDARQPEADPEIEKIAGDERALQSLYRQRLAQVRRGDVRGVSELKAKFRKAGLQL